MPPTPAQRLAQVQSHLEVRSQAPPHSARFVPALPKGLAVNFTPLNPVSFLLKAALIRPDHPAIVHPARNLQFTFREWALRVKDLAYAFKARGLARGDRVLTLLPNLPAHCDALQAIPAAQMIAVPINTRLSPADVEYIIAHSGARLVLVDSELVQLLPSSEVLSERGIQVVVCEDREGDGYDALLNEGREFDRQNGNTSGTTSRPKGVETSYRSTYLAAIANAHEARLDDQSVFLWTLPLFHCCGWCFPYATTLAMSTSVCLRGVGDYTEVWKGLLERGVTHYNAAPTVQLSIVNHPLARPLDRPVRTIVAGAAPTATLIEALERLNVVVVHVYGQTETLGPLTRTYYVGPKSSPDYYRNMARQGHSFVTADDIRIVRENEDDAHAPLVDVRSDGIEVGEIVFRGNVTMKGYWNNPEATEKVFAGGWLHSGDLAVRFPDGTFTIKDRSKDLIISGGENISSLSVENALSSHSHIHEVAVVAKKHEKWGERPHAFIVLKPEFAKRWENNMIGFERELKTFLRGKIPPFAIPDSFTHMSREAFDETKTATGKVQKKQLRELVNR